jgi:DNA-binding IclR family transcriptional regulator
MKRQGRCELAGNQLGNLALIRRRHMMKAAMTLDLAYPDASDDGTVVGRAVMILDAVSAAAGPVRLAELCRVTGIPKPTVHRIANDLAVRGMLERTEFGYRAGERLLKQGQQAALDRGYANAAQPYLQELHLRARGEVAWFGTLTGGDFNPVSMVFGPERDAMVRTSSFPTLSRIGTSIVLTAGGRLQIATQPELAERVRSHGCRRLTPYSPVRAGQLAALLDEAADTGFAYEQEHARVGCNCAAALVTSAEGVPIGVIGVTSFTSRTDTRGMRSPLLNAAVEMRRALASCTAHAGWSTA